MMTYNPPYYPALVEAAGFRKAKDLLAYWFDDRDRSRSTRLGAPGDRAPAREPDVVVRTISKRSLAADLPQDPRGLQRGVGEELGLRSDDCRGDGLHGRPPEAAPGPRISSSWPRAGGPTGPSSRSRSCWRCPTTTRDRAAERGRLLPFGWLRFLLRRRKIRTLRVVTLGIKRSYRMRGHPVGHVRAGPGGASLERGLTGCEVSWLLEDNELVIDAVEALGRAGSTRPTGSTSGSSEPRTRLRFREVVVEPSPSGTVANARRLPAMHVHDVVVAAVDRGEDQAAPRPGGGPRRPRARASRRRSRTATAIIVWPEGKTSSFVCSSSLIVRAIASGDRMGRRGRRVQVGLGGPRAERRHREVPGVGDVEADRQA